MNYSSTLKAHVTNHISFQETKHDHAFRLTGSPRVNAYLDTKLRNGTPQKIMEEESAREGIRANGSPKVREFRYELMMLRNAQRRTLAISRGKKYYGCDDCGKSGDGGARYFSSRKGRWAYNRSWPRLAYFAGLDWPTLTE